MSEPTPLSAEQPYSRDELVHLAENMRHPTVQQIVGATGQKTINRLLATIDAQATEIAILKDGRCVSCMESCNPLHPKCACIRAEIAEMEAEIAALKGQRDKAETTLEMVNALATGYGWLSEGRGMYAYDDGRYDDDVRTFVGQLLELMPSGNWLGFPEWEAKYRRMEAEIEGYRQALKNRQQAAHDYGIAWAKAIRASPSHSNPMASCQSPGCALARRVLAGKEAQGG